MKAHGLEHHCLAITDAPLNFLGGKSPGITDLFIKLLQLVQPGQIFRGSDEQDQKWMTFRGGSHIENFQPVRFRFQQVKIIYDLVPAGQLPVCTHPEPEKIFRVCDGPLGIHTCGEHQGE